MGMEERPMNLLRWWPTLRTSVIAVALAITAIGLGQFAFTELSGPCFGIHAPLDRFCTWLREGRQGPPSELLDSYELERLRGLSVSMMVLGAALLLSIVAQRPFRLRLTLRTLMLAVAILPIGYLAGQRAWSMWFRWDCYQRTIHEIAEVEKREMREDPSDPPEVIAVKRESAVASRRVRMKLQRKVWSPWFWFTLVSRVPYS
jgi:hypothetical protein